MTDRIEPRSHWKGMHYLIAAALLATIGERASALMVWAMRHSLALERRSRAPQ